MINDCIIDFDALLKNYKDVGIYEFDIPSVHKYLISIAINFKDSFTEIKTSNPYVIVLKTIAYYLQSNHIIMTKNKIYDFLIITYKFLNYSNEKIKDNQSNSKSQVIDDSLFDICNDILNQYGLYEDSVRIQIPNLIVDVITGLLFKSDPYGNKISVFQIKSFYMSKKEAIINKNYSYPSEMIKKSFNDPESITCDKDNNNNEYCNVLKEERKISHNVIKKESFNFLSNIENNEKLFFDNDVVYRISQITNRDIDSIRQSLSKVTEKEIKKLIDICNNHDKIIRLSKINNITDFKFEIERDLNRSLSDKQIRHSQISIKKVQFYIESLLDSKFEIHLTHGINHVKHNFEYGYRLAGLLKNSKSIS